MDERDLLLAAYRDFNARSLDAVLDRLHPEVEWANGMEGGHLKGIDAVQAYWTRQWATIDPNVEPLLIEHDKRGVLWLRFTSLFAISTASFFLT